MAQAWDNVQRSVAIYGWLKTKIMAPYKSAQLRELKESVGNQAYCALQSHVGTEFPAYRAAAVTRAGEPKINGKGYVEVLSTTYHDFDTVVPETYEQFALDVLNDISAGISSLQSFGVIEDLGVDNSIALMYDE